MFFTTRMVIGSNQLPANGGFLADLYCHLLAFRFMLFVFGRGSLLTVMCLAIERWVSIVKPLYFKTSFSTKRVYAYLAVIWGVSCFIRGDKLYAGRASGTRCYRMSIMSKELDTILHTVYLIITFCIPLIITWSAFFHIWIHLRKVQWAQARAADVAKKRLVRMCAVTALLLTICWFPSSASSLVRRFVDGGDVADTVHKCFLTLAMFNSCCNPTVYYFTNKEYKREINRLLCSWRRCQAGVVVSTALNKRFSGNYYTNRACVTDENIPGLRLNSASFSLQNNGADSSNTTTTVAVLSTRL